MNPQEYEQVVRGIVASIAEQYDGNTTPRIESGAKNKWTGKSGCKHQIDVSVEDGESVTLIECKRWKKKIGIGAVRDCFGVIHDIKRRLAGEERGQVAGGILTTVGFTKPAKRFAEHYKIDLDIVRSTSEYGLLYKNRRLVRPQPASFALGASDPKVDISEQKNR